MEKVPDDKESLPVLLLSFSGSLSLRGPVTKFAF